MINKDKMTVMFSPNTTEEIKKQVLTELNITRLASNENIWACQFMWESQRNVCLKSVDTNARLAGETSFQGR
jgi:hypothetical protein